MNIKQFSEKTDLSAHTIRYYEKIGLLKNIARNTSGHRSFTDKDLVWVKFIKRLKDTGMPLDNILQYAHLRAEGETTSDLRMQILQQHAATLEAKISEEQLHLQKLQQKIRYYQQLIHEQV